MYLGLDLGTSGLKALLVSSDGATIASETSTYKTEQPHPDWSEQDPQLWIAACSTVLDNLRRSYSDEYADIRAIAISGHMHGAVAVDDSGKALRPCILWNDMRSADEAAKLDANPIFRAQSGNIVFPGFTAPQQ